MSCTSTAARAHLESASEPDGIAEETAYYLNRQVPAVALIAEGTRLPRGRWLRLASLTASAWQVEDLLAHVFPALQGNVVRFETLTSEAEVRTFETSLPR
jgi:hypothetical protein